jgi:hypothetical protein
LKYCDIATRLLKINTVCGVECPIYEDCPLLIMEDATDKAINQAIKRIIEIKEGK